jgi:excisionase family DNA binding protein
MPEQLLDLADVAERLGIGYQTALKWAQKGHLPVIQIGKRYFRMRASDLEALLVPKNVAA